MLERYRKIILLLIILAGFVLRFYAADSVPVNEDEWYDFRSARDISFSLENPNLPLIDKENDNSSMVFRYLIQAGWHVFGDFLLGARLPFVILGTLTILIVYLLTKQVLGIKTALLASFLLSISQFAISTTRFADICAVIPLIIAVSLLLFYRAIESNSNGLLLLNGLIMGIGFWFKETLLILIPIYIVFLLVCREYRGWLKSKYLWISFVLTFFVISPFIFLILNPDSTRINYVSDAVFTGLSMGPLSLYAGELILLAIKPFPEFFNRVAATVNSESMLVSFVLGTIVLVAAVKYIKDKRPFLRLLVVHFLFVFVIFSFFKTGDPAWGIWNFESFYYSTITFIPGIILAAILLKDAASNGRYWGKIFFVFVMIFTLFRAWDCAAFPLNYFFPAKDFCIKELLNYEGGCFRNNNNISRDIAEDIFERIYRITDNKPAHKRKAALRLAEILIQEGKRKESKEYLYFILSQTPDDTEALELLERLKNRKKANVQWVGAWPHGPINTAALKDNICYVGAGGEIEIWDISNLTHPLKVQGIFTKGIVMDLKVEDNFLYVSCGCDGAYIFDISKPTNPQKISSISSKDWTVLVAVFGDFLYKCDSYVTLSILDISNPSNPKEISHFDSGNEVTGIFFHNNYVYLACGNAGLYILDISNPFNPKEISHFDAVEGDVEDVFILNNYAYLACDEKGLYILDISNPASPEQISHFDVSGEAGAIFIHNNYAYLACGNAGLSILDISDPSNPKKISHFDSGGEAEDVFIHNNYAYLVCDEGGIYILDISNPASPKEISHFDVSGEAEAVFIRNNYAYLACGDAGQYILDISDPARPKEISHFDSGGDIDIFINKDFAYLADNEAKVTFIHKDHAYVGKGRNLYILDSLNLSQPLSQQKVAYCLPDNIKDIFVKEKGGYVYIYIANEDAGLQILRK